MVGNPEHVFVGGSVEVGEHVDEVRLEESLVAGYSVVSENFEWHLPVGGELCYPTFCFRLSHNNM